MHSPTDYQTFQPRVEALVEAHKQDIELAASLEKRTAALIKQYGTHVSCREPGASLDLRVRSALWDPYRTSFSDRSAHYLSYSSRGMTRFVRLKIRSLSWSAIRLSDTGWDMSERPRPPRRQPVKSADVPELTAPL